MPELQAAASVGDLSVMRKQSRALAIIYGFVIFALAAGMVALFWVAVKRVLAHPETVGDMGFIIALAIPWAFGLVGVIWLWEAMSERWRKHSPVKASEFSAFNAVRDSYYVKLYSRSVEEVERYRCDILQMGREFTRHDLQFLDDYRSRITTHNWNLEFWEQEQSEFRRLYGNKLPQA